jgi:hypothetical protein
MNPTETGQDRTRQKIHLAFLRNERIPTCLAHKGVFDSARQGFFFSMSSNISFRRSLIRFVQGVKELSARVC